MRCAWHAARGPHGYVTNYLILHRAGFIEGEVGGLDQAYALSAIRLEAVLLLCMCCTHTHTPMGCVAVADTKDLSTLDVRAGLYFAAIHTYIYSIQLHWLHVYNICMPTLFILSAV